MTETERLAKNQRIKQKGQQTKLKRKKQVCRVFRLKIDFSHLNKTQRDALKMLFVEAKWLYNDILTFMKAQNLNDYDYRVQTVYGLDKDKNKVVHALEYISSQMRQSVIQEIKSSLKSLSSVKQKQRKVGSLKYKSDYASINLQQYGITYKFYDSKHIKIQGFKKKIKVEGTEQFFNLPEIEYANAKLLNLPDGYYIAVTTFQNKENINLQSGLTWE